MYIHVKTSLFISLTDKSTSKMIRKTNSQSICETVLYWSPKKILKKIISIQKDRITQLGKIKTYIQGNPIISEDSNSLKKIPGATRNFPRLTFQSNSKQPVRHKT